MRPATLVLAAISATLMVPLAPATSRASSRTVEADEVRRAMRLSQKAETRLQRGDLPGARKLFFRAIDIVEALPSAHIGLGHVAMREGRFEVALRQYEAAEIGWREISRALLRIRQLDQINRYSRSARERDLRVDQLEAGRFAAAAGDVLAPEVQLLEGGLDKMEQVVPPRPAQTFTPVPGEVYFYIGNALYMLGRLDNAIDNWESCAELSPQFAEVYGNLALGFRRLGDEGRARHYLELAEEKGLEIPPERWRAAGGE